MAKKKKLGTRFRPSSADRYLACPASVVMTQDYPYGEGSVHADTGTVAHKLGEICIETGEPLEKYIGQSICSDEGIDIPVTKAMVESVQVYVDWVKSMDFDLVLVEESAPLDFVPGTETSSGRIDLVAVHRDFNLLYVVDYKNGILPVGADTNQLGTYALAIRDIAVAKGWIDEVTEIVAVVGQPNAFGEDPIKVHTWNKEMLDELKERIVDTVNWVLDTKPEEISDDMFNDGKHCKFCPYEHMCPVKAAKLFDIVPIDTAAKLGTEQPKLKGPSVLSPEVVAKIVERKKEITDWLNAVTSYAFSELKCGREIQGVKLVKGRRGRKTWKKSVSEEKLSNTLLTLGLDDEQIFTKKLLTPTQAEKLLKKTKALAIKDLIQEGEQSTELTCENDPRESATQQLF